MEQEVVSLEVVRGRSWLILDGRCTHSSLLRRGSAVLLLLRVTLLGVTLLRVALLRVTAVLLLSLLVSVVILRGWECGRGVS